jgi:Flp pilus assembly protein TadG
MGWAMIRRRHRSESADDRGAVAVEFALVLPILVMLMFGIFSAGVAYSDHLAVTNSVREGARLGSAIGYTGTGEAWADAVQDRVQQVYMNGTSTLSESNVCVVLENAVGGNVATPTAQGTSCGTAPTSPSSPPAGTCVVKVWVRKPAEISLLVTPPLSFNIGAQSVSFYGRTAGVCKAS